MKIAKQEDIDRFMERALMDESIYPYLSVCKYVAKKEAPKDDWEKIILISETGNTLLSITLNRHADMAWNVNLYSFNSFGAGRAVSALKSLIIRYKPRSISSCVHQSNHKSIKFHERIYGQPWGIETLEAWNSLKGEYEDLYWYKIIL